MHWPLTFKVYSLSWKLKENTYIFKDLTSKKLNTIGTVVQVFLVFTLKAQKTIVSTALKNRQTHALNIGN